jgi:uncharacterized protein with ParB-like and HNH nuclease domain
MDVHKSSLLSVFDVKQRLEVPLFQRQYVWDEEQQWYPLWEDIERKFSEALTGRLDAPHHFLGAMVLDQKQTPTGHVVVRQVIDGQQRLTTLQIFLAAYRDFCKQEKCDALAAECEKFLFNAGMMANPDVDKFKVWPTQADREQFKNVVGSGSRDELLKRYPVVKRPYARKPEPRPRMVEAYLFFFEQLRAFFLGEENESPIAAEVEISTRVDECFQTLRNALMVVVIDLQKDDDPQVIFETLNARGAALLPADLLKNYIFFRVSRANLDVEASYEKYWAKFDDDFWRAEVKQGRLIRPRSDLFMQHFLASQQGQDIPIKHLFVEYRHWVETAKPFAHVTDELSSLASQGNDFRRIIAPEKTDVIFRLCSFLDAYDIRTAYPLLLAFFEAKLSNENWDAVSKILESYLFRRSICNLSTKNYNRIFLSLTRGLRKDGFDPARLRALLLDQNGESSVWPDDPTFRNAWLQDVQYGPLNNAKLVHLFSRLNETFMSSKVEKISIEQPLTIEHIMPQSWWDNWPLADGSKGMTYVELSQAASGDPRTIASVKRLGAIHRLGNLTILTAGLNAAQSNLPWKQKLPEIKKHSLLPINQMLDEFPVWDEGVIDKRAELLFERALKIWKR